MEKKTWYNRSMSLDRRCERAREVVDVVDELEVVVGEYVVVDVDVDFTFT